MRILGLALAILSVACGPMDPIDGNAQTTGFDAGAADSGSEPPGDAGVEPDAGAKPDAGAEDAGTRPPDDHADQRGEGSRLAVGQGIAGNLDGNGDVDWFVFTAGLGDLHRIETRGDSDTRCALFDRDGAPVADDDDSGEGLNCRMEESLVGGAEYYVRVNHFSDSGTGAYTLFIDIIDAQLDPPTLRTSAARISAGEGIDLTGTGFSLGSLVTISISWDGGAEQTLETYTDELGSLSVRWQTTRDETPGFYTLTAVDTQTNRSSASTSVQVTPPLEDDHGDSREEASQVVFGRFTPGEIHVAGDVDWFTFNPPRRGLWTISTRGALDTVCTLFEGEEQVARDDDGGEGFNCRIETQLEAGRRFYIRVESFGQRIGDYELVVVPPPVPDDHGDTPETATVFANPGRRTAELGAGDVDVFGFTAWVSGSFNIGTGGLTDTDCRLVELGGGEVAHNDNGGFAFNCEMHPVLQQGHTYFLYIRHGDPEGTGAYWATILAPAGSPADDHGNTAELATLVAPGTTTPGNIEVGGDRDHFQFYADRSGSFIVETSSDMDTTCRISEAGGDEIGSNDDAGAGRNCRMAVTLRAGQRYTVQVRLFSAQNTGQYRLVVRPG